MEEILNLQFSIILNILIICTTHLVHGFQTPPTNETDMLALLAFKDHIVEDPLGVLSSWNESLHFCNWRGVSCSQRHQGRVTALNLGGQKLVGSIPPHIGNLSFLRQVNLGYNNFKGDIPKEIGWLFRLRYLNVSHNALQGQIPSNLAFCSEMQVITFAYNNLVGEIPKEFQNLSRSLIMLGVSANQLIGSIPQWLGNASSLIGLSLVRNHFHGSIPVELGRLGKLEQLLFDDNNLSGSFPLSIFNLSSLINLSFGKNQLYGKIPSNIGFTLPNLQYLTLGGNHFYGEIPTSLLNMSKLILVTLTLNNFSGVIPLNFGSLSNLQFLELFGNQLEAPENEGLGFLTSFTNCSNLQELDLGHNNFKGELPNSIANFSTNLKILWMDRNRISGKIPKEIGNLVGLTTLDISMNYITGEIPSSIGRLDKLSELDLYQNRISGLIPSFLGNITQLQELGLFDNNLSGIIPPSLGNCSQLEKVILENNYLFGIIPKQLLSISSMISLSLSGNSFMGELPLDVGNMTHLWGFSVSHNKLSGGIPTTLGKCLMLERLWMQDNFFEGSIPPSFSTLKSLIDLDLSRNNLSGQIPKYLPNFTLLQNLNLSFNNFQGEVPTEGIFRNTSIISVNGNQRLCGGIQQLGLPPCQGVKKKGKFQHLKVVISIIVSCSLFLIVVLLAIFSYKKKSKRTASTTVQEKEFFPQISYAELSQAVNEFSPSNLVGKGSFGSVYKGILAANRMIVAVKVLNLKQKGAAKSFLAECEALSNIRHRNLIKIITVCSSIDFKGSDFKAIIYEFMQNGSLEEWLHPHENQGVREFNFIQRLNVAIDVAFALEYLHHYCQPVIVHGDLKPSNVLLDHDMVAHVGDFGMSRIFRNDGSPSNASREQNSSIGIKGTIGYIPPEYGMGSKASMEGDVYSFGIMLLEMITGKRPVDPMFNDGFNIQQFTKTALPERVMEILAPSLSQEVHVTDNRGIEHSRARNNMGRRIGVLESLSEIARVGVFCSMESPNERMEMKQVVAELSAIKHRFLGARN
ncbi:hypothetical protein SLEP1_g58232 [Rubroshorea leprosula]|uniref:non-specific serine/threonine protein kinase n=1 Tax=Rubroshorea leprosula TaxID=152421 RepID=A0AAV5MSA3_9ROSI|nr:hypothetical protein SLEP1_g58232 [Rubroshorea leprosula]